MTTIEDRADLDLSGLSANPVDQQRLATLIADSRDRASELRRRADSLEATAHHWEGVAIGLSRSQVVANPTFEDCSCCVTTLMNQEREDDARRIHDMILAIDQTPLRAIYEILDSLEYDATFVETGGILGCYTFEKIVGQHNWADPPLVDRLAELFDLIRERMFQENTVADADIEGTAGLHKALTV